MFVQDLPEDVRTTESLLALFRRFYPTREVHSACVLPDCRTLDVMMTEAEALSKKLGEEVTADAEGKVKAGKCCFAKKLSETIPKTKEVKDATSGTRRASPRTPPPLAGRYAG